MNRSNADELAEWAQQALGYRFAERGLLLQALTHASFVGDSERDHNGRLEFLGDSILNAAVSNLLFRRFPTEPEGLLTKKRVAMVCNEHLSEVGRELGVASRVRVGKSMEAQMAQGNETVVADAVEALVGAVFLDGGFGDAQRVVEKILFSRGIPEYSNAKGLLQEKVVARFGELPVYHRRSLEGGFESRVVIKGQCMGVGRGRSKKEADQRAAREALKLLEGEQ